MDAIAMASLALRTSPSCSSTVTKNCPAVCSGGGQDTVKDARAALFKVQSGPAHLRQLCANSTITALLKQALQQGLFAETASFAELAAACEKRTDADEKKQCKDDLNKVRSGLEVWLNQK